MNEKKKPIDATVKGGMKFTEASGLYRDKNDVLQLTSIYDSTLRDDSTPIKGWFISKHQTFRATSPPFSDDSELHRLSENQVEDHELIRSLEHFAALIFFWCLGLTVAVIALIL